MTLRESNYPRATGLRWLAATLLVAVAVQVATAATQRGDTIDSPAAQALRVCADPSNMPFSNDAEQGFENKIAALLARKLGVPVDYYWIPEQMGFGRNSLKRWIASENRYACDLVISAGSGFDVGKTTRPYYRSSYAMAFVQGQGQGQALDDIDSPQDLTDLAEDRKKNLRIGVFTGSPVADWLVSHGMVRQIVGYRAQSGGYDADPGDMVSQDLVNGDIDIAMIWGPIAGYYAKQSSKADIKVIAFRREDGPTFDFPVSMAVRYGNDAWLDTVQSLIDDNRDAIVAILEDYGVPLIALRDEDFTAPEDDDD